MSGQFKAAWRFTALPVLAVLAVLIGAGVYLQVLASRIQKQPLTIHVKTLTSPISAAVAVQIEEDVEIAEQTAPAGVAGEIQGLIEENRVEEALSRIEQEIDTDPALMNDREFVLVYARVLGELGRYDQAVQVLRAPEQEEPDARLAFAIGLNLSRAGDKLGAIDAYERAADANPLFYEAWFNAGVLYQSLGRYELAIHALETAVPLAAGTRRARTMNNLADAYRKAGRFAEAEQMYKSAINLYPGDTAVRLDLADLYRLDTGDIESATSMYEEVLRLDEGNGDAVVGLAEIFVGQQRRLDAYQILADSVVLNPTHEQMRRYLAMLYMTDGRNDEARAELTWLEENGADTADAVFLLGRIAYSERDYAEAAALYERAFSLSGETHLESLNNLGLSYKAQLQTEDAKAAFEAALSIDPLYRNAHYNLGLLLIDDEDYSRARDAFLQTVEIDPEYAQGWYNLAISHGKLGAHDDAIAAYEEALRIQPGNAKARLNLAVQYGKVGNRDRAVEQYRLVLALNPANPTAWYNLAISLKALGKPADSEEAYRNAIRLDPGEVKYWRNFSLLLSSQDRTPEVISLLEEAIDIHTDSPVLRYYLALQYRKLEQNERAADELKNVVALDPSYLKAWTILADLQSDSDDHVSAVRSYETAVSIAPDDGYVRYQLGKEYYRLERFEDAEREFLRSLDAVRDNAWIWYNLGKTREQLGEDGRPDFDRALEIDISMGRFIYRRLEKAEDSLALLEEMIEEDPSNAKIRAQYADMLRRDGQVDRAVVELNVASQLAPSDPLVWLSIAEVAMEIRNPDQAESAFRRARELDPGNGKIAYEYGKFLQDAERFTEAAALFEQAVALYEVPYFAYRHLGESLYELKQYKPAVEAFSAASQLRPESTATRYDLGKAMYRAKDYQGALDAFEVHAADRSDYYWSFIWLGRAQARLEMYEQALASYTRARELDRSAVQPLISLGDLAVRMGNNREARRRYEAALELDPLHESTRRKLEGLTGQ